MLCQHCFLDIYTEPLAMVGFGKRLFYSKTNLLLARIWLVEHANNA